MNAPDIATAISEKEARKLRQLASGKRVLELGAWLGFSTAVMCQSAKEVHTVDHFEGDEYAGVHPDQLQHFKDNTFAYENLVLHVGSFEDILPTFSPKEFEFCFLDGDHSAEATRFAAKWAKRLTRGPLAFHDYGLFGVTEVVDELGGPKELVNSLAII